MSYDQHLDRIYGYNSDPNAGKWYVSGNHNYVRHFNDHKEIIHKVTPRADSEEAMYGSGDMWTVSIGGPNNEYQVGDTYFNTTTEAKQWADNRNDEELDALDWQVTKWRERSQ